ncbi:MAG: GNAT family N-acetyltransferase [Saprospiraceae bacterium]|nr:GNAT family N-acetyltransferase [Saprospiraceae bacterium]
MYFDLIKDIFLENEVAFLRPIEEADFDNLLTIALKDKDLLQFSPRPIHSEELLRKYIDRAVQLRRLKSRYTFIVWDKTKKLYAGSSSFLNISEGDDRLEIGATWYGTEFQRTGLNRNCKFLMLEYAFEVLNVVRVEFKTDERNLASRTAIEKIGGKFEGILRHHTLMFDGFRRNTVCYNILKSEWEDLKNSILIQK